MTDCTRKGLLVLLWLAPCLSASAEEMVTTPTKIEGHLAYIVYSKSGTVRSELQVQFIVTLNPPQWNIRTVYPESGTVQEAGYNGTNIFQVLQPPPSVTATSKFGLAATILKDGDYPEWMHPCGKVIWLALASTQFLDRSSNAAMPYPWLGNFGGLHPYNVTRSEKAPRLPQSINFWGVNASEKKGKQATGFIEGTYSSDRTTNIMLNVECEFPLEFEVKRYWPPQYVPKAAGSNSLTLYNSFIGKVTNLGPSVLQRILPTLNGKVSVNDRRFFDPSGTVSHIQYALTNSDWAARDQPELVAKLDQSISEVKRKLATRKPTTFRWLYLLFLLTFIGLPLAVILYHKRSKNL